jgi:hypothetical protein
MEPLLHGSARTTPAIRHAIQASTDRTSKLAFAELNPAATAELAATCWQRVVEAVPYTIHRVLTDNGVQFTLPNCPIGAAR